jgi:hypothetical protein
MPTVYPVLDRIAGQHAIARLVAVKLKRCQSCAQLTAVGWPALILIPRLVARRVPMASEENSPALHVSRIRGRQSLTHLGHFGALSVLSPSLFDSAASRNSIPVKKRWSGHFSVAEQACSRAHCLCVWSRRTCAPHIGQYSKGESNTGHPLSFNKQHSASLRQCLTTRLDACQRLGKCSRERQSLPRRFPFLRYSFAIAATLI